MDDDFRLTIGMTGSEFGADEALDRCRAVARVLRETAAKLEDGQMSGRIMDINGNVVGEFEFD